MLFKSLLANHPLWFHNIDFLLGLVCLIQGANMLVKNASRFATAIGIKPVVVGLTIVAFGTSAPELTVSSIASYTGKGGIAIGNIIGSNIANIGLILGIVALVKPLKVEAVFFTSELPIMLTATAVFIVTLHDGVISRIEGAILVAVLMGYVYIYVHNVRNAKEIDTAIKSDKRRVRSIALMIIGLLLLASGAHRMVVSGASLARTFGINEVVIGVTLFAVGSSLPELATCLMGIVHKQEGISIGNIVGSNIFNIACVAGVAALIAPLHVDHDVFTMEVPVLLLFSAGLLLIMRTGYRIDRKEGLLLLVSYIAFIVGLFV